MVKRFVVPFAATGDKSATPDATDPSGAISYSQGWGPQYQLPNTDPAYRPVGRPEMNGVLNDITGAIAELQQIGYPEWVAPGGLVPNYAINATVRHLDNVYRSAISNNSSVPGTDSNWRVDYSRGVQRITASGSFTVPLGVVLIYITAAAAGGGGGGGGSNNVGNAAGSCAGGGGAGQTINRVPFNVTPGQVIPITLGAAGGGGTGGAQSLDNATDGFSGTNTVIGSLVTLTGGLGGGRGRAAASGGPVGGGGGGGGFPTGGSGSDGAGAAAATVNGWAGMSGAGGGTLFGGGGPGQRCGIGSGSAGNPGNQGGGPGAGGSGGSAPYASGGAGGNGGNANNGIVIIEW